MENVKWKTVQCVGCVLPPMIDKGLNDYVGYGVNPGGFLRAVLENDLHGAVARADAQNMAMLRLITQHVYNCLPDSAWGSKAKVEAFLARKNDEEWDRAALK